MPGQTRKPLLASLFISAALLSQACVTIPNTRQYAVAGKLADGMIFAETQTDVTGDLTFDEAIDLLEPQLERECVPVVGAPICSHDQSSGKKVTLPARGGAVCTSAEDAARIKTALEQACTELGNRCSYEMKSAIRSLSAPSRIVRTGAK